MQVKKYMLGTIRIASALFLVIAIASSLSACSHIKNQHEDVINESVRRAAILELAESTLLSSGCRYGLTLTNNLTVEIRDLTFRFMAYNGAGVRLQTVTRGFFGIKPTLQQYVQISFGFECSEIRRIEVGGFGRCSVGELKLRSKQPGSCIDLVDISPNPFVQLIKTKDD